MTPSSVTIANHEPPVSSPLPPIWVVLRGREEENVVRRTRQGRRAATSNLRSSLQQRNTPRPLASGITSGQSQEPGPLSGKSLLEQWWCLSAQQLLRRVLCLKVTVSVADKVGSLRTAAVRPGNPSSPSVALRFGTQRTSLGVVYSMADISFSVCTGFCFRVFI